MNLRAVLLVAVVAGSLPFAAASSHIETGDVAGRTILFDLTRFDPDLAAVAGHAASRSSWFDGTIVRERSDDGFVWATAAGSPPPMQKTLFPTGVWYNFTDDNGATWRVQEWYHLHIEEYQYMLAGHAAVEKLAYRVYVWTVHTSAEPITDAIQGVDYNFVVVVDVTKLKPVPADPQSGETLGHESATQEASGFEDLEAASTDGAASAGKIDLHFSSTDPADRCSVCEAGADLPSSRSTTVTSRSI